MSSFHLNIYIFLFRFCTRHSKMSLFHCSIWMKFLFWYGISFWYHVNWKRTVIWIRRIANFVLWGEWCMLSDLVRKPCKWECLRLRLDFRLLPGSAFDPSRRETLLGGWVQAHFLKHWLVMEVILGEPVYFIMCMQHELYSGMKLIQEWKSLRYNIISPLIWPLLCGHLFKEDIVTL